MATEVISTTFQLKRGLASAWERANPILAPGEPGWTLDTHVLKIGDGVTPWNGLDSVSGAEIKEAVRGPARGSEDICGTVGTDNTADTRGTEGRARPLFFTG